MELIRISDSKLKIMLTPTDMCHFELNTDLFAKDSEQTKIAFRHLMEEIKKQIGFDADDNRISVQYFPSREGGCEMFVTQLQARPPITDGKDERAHSSQKALQLHQSQKSNGAFRRDCAYRFETLNDLLLVCKRLQQIGYIGDSSAFRDEKKQYYLLLTLLCSSPFSMPEEFNFVLEYGYWENAAMLKLYIREHGSLIASPDAVSELSSLS